MPMLAETVTDRPPVSSLEDGEQAGGVKLILLYQHSGTLTGICMASPASAVSL